VPITADRVEIIDAGPLVGRVQVTRSFGPSTAVVTYELRADSSQLLVHIALDWHHDEHLLSMAFPLDVRSDRAMCDIQFGVVARPTHPSSPWDAAKFEVCAHRFVDVAEPDFGVAISNTGRYGHGVFDGAVRVSLAKAAKYPDPNADRGHHEVTLAIRPHGGGLADVRDAAARINSPLRVVSGGTAVVAPDPIVRVVDADGGAAPGIEVDAVKLADDGSGDLIVRLHEAVGNRTRICVATPGRVVEAWRCNLLEESQTGEEVGDGVVTLTLRPFQILTLRLRRTATDDGRTREHPHPER
jgi:alpha-mannosidase